MTGSISPCGQVGVLSVKVGRVNTPAVDVCGMESGVRANGPHPLLRLRCQLWNVSIWGINDEGSSNRLTDTRQSASTIKEQLVVSAVDVHVRASIPAIETALFQIIFLVRSRFRFRDRLLPFEFVKAFQGRQR